MSDERKTEAQDIEVKIESCMNHSGLVEKVNGLTDWQERQNGTLKDICAEVKSVKAWVIATLLTILLASGLLKYFG